MIDEFEDKLRYNAMQVRAIVNSYFEREEQKRLEFMKWLEETKNANIA